MSVWACSFFWVGEKKNQIFCGLGPFAGNQSSLPFFLPKNGKRKVNFGNEYYKIFSKLHFFFYSLIFSAVDFQFISF